MTNTKSNRTAWLRASTAGAIVAALAASACCVLPALLAIVGLSGIGFAAALEPYRPIFLGAAAVLLGLGFWLTYRKPKAAAADGEGRDACACETPRVGRSGRVMLWVATVLVAAFAATPFIAGAFTSESAPGSAAPVANAAVARIGIEKMTCKSCIGTITQALARIPGVIKAEVSLEQRRATVTYDPAQVKPERLVEAITAIGYPAKLEG
jgi:mercuric ion transport protein